MCRQNLRHSMQEIGVEMGPPLWHSEELAGAEDQAAGDQAAAEVGVVVAVAVAAGGSVDRTEAVADPEPWVQA